MGLDHPAYDCVYLAAADALAATFVTADAKLLRKLAGRSGIAALDLAEAAARFGSRRPAAR